MQPVGLKFLFHGKRPANVAPNKHNHDFFPSLLDGGQVLEGMVESVPCEEEDIAVLDAVLKGLAAEIPESVVCRAPESPRAYVLNPFSVF